MYDSLISPVKVNHFKMFLIDTNAITGEKFPQQNIALFNRFYLKNKKPYTLSWTKTFRSGRSRLAIFD